MLANEEQMVEQQPTPLASEATVQVRVALRIRPAPNPARIALVRRSDSPQVTLTIPHADPSKKTFTFDTVFDPDESQEAVFQDVYHVVEGFVQGFNGTILAYGQTSSGKTYTMGTGHTQQVSENEKGVIPRALEHMFYLIQQKRTQNSQVDYVLRISFVEIYQEQVRDLLNPSADPKDISIFRSTKTGTTTITGVNTVVINTVDDALALLERGALERTTGVTGMNESSSRSHAVFEVMLEEQLKMISSEEPRGQEVHHLLRYSKLHLVDLAGSERLKRTKASGIRFKESVKINSGLLALGNVISILGSDNNTEDRYVPYRESKLTRLLQDSLGGNSRTIMIACVSPSEEDADETLNTLKYASRARKICNKPVVNTVDMQAAHLVAMQDRIQYLENRLMSYDHIEPTGHELTGDVDNDPAMWIERVTGEMRRWIGRGQDAMKELESVRVEKHNLTARVQELEAWVEHLSADSRDRSRSPIKGIIASERDELIRRVYELEGFIMAHMPGSVGIAEHMTKQDDMQSEKAQQLQTTLEENERLQSRVLELETVLQRVTQAGDQHATQEQEVHEAMQQQIDQLIQSNNRLTSEKDQIESTVAQLQSDLLALVNCLSSGKLDDVGQEIVKRIRPDSAISLGEIRFGAESDTGAGLKDEYDEVLPPIVDLVAGPRSPSRPLKPRSHRRRLRGPNSLHEGDDEHNRLVASLHRLEDELFASEQRVKELLSEREIANAKPRSDVEVQTVQVEEAEDVEKDDMQRNIYILQGALAAAEQNVEKLACVVERLEKVNINLVNENDALKEQHQAHEAIIGLHAKEVDRTKQMVDWGSESDEAEQYSGSGTHSPSENASVLGPDDFPVHVSNVNRQHIGSDVHSEVDHSKRQEDKQDGHSGIPWNDPARSQLIVDLELANRARVEAAKEVARVNKEAERVRQQYNERVIKLERDLEAANRDVSKLGAELVEKDQAREKLKEEHDRKIKALDAQILKLKAKQKDYNRLAKEKDALERRCEEVKPEVERLKVIANDLKKKLKDDGDRHNEVEKRLTKDLARVEKQRDEEIRRCRSLEDEVELLRRRVASGRTRPGGTNSAKRRISGRGVGDDFDLDVVAPEAKNANSDGRQEKESRPATTDATHVDATSAKYRSVIDSLRDQINEGQGILSGLDRDSVMYSKVLEKVELLTLRLQEAKEQAREESETQAQPDDTNEVRWNSLEKRAASYGDTVVASVQQLRASPIATSVKMHVVQAITAIMDQYDAVSLRRPPHSASQASQTDIVLHMDSNIPPECECARYQTMIKELKEKLKMVVGVNHRLAGALERERKRGVDAR